MEENLASKMHEFMTMLDQVKKYRAIVTSLTDFAIIIATTAVATMLIIMAIPLGVVFYKYSLEGGQLYFLAMFILMIGITLALFRVNQRVQSISVGEWKTTLAEGTPGVLKLLHDVNWETIFSDIKLSKLGLALYGASKIFVYWLITTVVLYFVKGLLESTLHMNISSIVTAMVSLVIVLFLSKKDLRKRYSQIGRLDSLLWELRWFDSEFRRADFQT